MGYKINYSTAVGEIYWPENHQGVLTQIPVNIAPIERKTLIDKIKEEN